MSNEPIQYLVLCVVDAMPAELTPHLPNSTHESQEKSASGCPDYNTAPLLDSILAQSEQNTEQSKKVPATNGHASLKAETSATIDWETESQPPSNLMSILLTTNMPPPATPPGCIVLTGVSGLFGRHLLTYLRNKTPSYKIICTAVRDLTRRLQEGELVSGHPRVEYYPGDLATPLLGLSSEQAAAIFAVADVVIHNGADTSHMKSYRNVRASNVGSTLELARLCLPRRVPLHFVSSAGLAVLYVRDEFPPVSVTGPGCARPAEDGSFGYASSKWTCEAVLERIHAQYSGSWPVCIHRPSTIVREGNDAVGGKASREEVSYTHLVGDRLIPLDQLDRIGLEESKEGELFDTH
ncbi:male sterility protein-domain-containing protein [Xylaria scruposa]|nr:male sterility protein-domain-containing protein [Xylaria scruposa]